MDGPGGAAFRSAATGAQFFAAYDAVLAQWPVPVRPADVRTGYGTTRVLACGPEDGWPLVLLHGGGATAAVWFANAAELSRGRRLLAIDQIGQAGRSVAGGKPVAALGDLMTWLDEVLAGLGVHGADLCGHSYGGWLALSYALRSPQRVRRLALLDPTMCFTGMRLSYRLHAVPLLARPSPERMLSLIRWETGGAPVNETWLRLTALGTGFRSAKIVLPRRPAASELAALAVPVMVLTAEHSRQHDIARLADHARRLVPDVRTAVLPGVSHHSVPTERAGQLNEKLTDFLA